MTNTYSSRVQADYALPPKQLATAITLCVDARRPCMVWGPPGVGKSAVVQQVASALGREYVDIRALLLDPVDLRGIPYRDGNITRWAPPVFLPQDDGKPYLLNLEEISAAPPMVQASLYQLVLDRRLGEYVVPDNVEIVACGNRESDRGAAIKMQTPLASRFVHFDMSVDVKQWSQWAARNSVDPSVLFFIEYRPQLLHEFNPRSKEAAFPCPRTWEFVSDLVKANGTLDDTSQMAMLRGTVGEAAAVEFSAFLRMWRNLPSVQSILADPDRSPVPENASVRIATCGALYGAAKDDNLDSIIRYTGRMNPELQAFTLGMAVSRDPGLMKTIPYVDWASQQ